ncbi:uncharacterized protein LOC119453004 [Dermacentor silvarum]|uniref:uncharacterized protein LOC119453004 n=1 Tax=Dermacentor silvarum TaxID=543639 RepID=UPI002100C699|nr:uncharacterized protein LOC119453004 [Dermacentor silvarum]
MKPPVSSSSDANACAQDQCKATDGQCSFTGEPISTCVKAADGGDASQTQLNGQADTSCVGGAVQVDVAEPRQNEPISTCVKAADGGDASQTQLNGQADTSFVGGAMQVDVAEPLQNEPISTDSQNGAEQLSTNETHVNGRLDIGSNDDVEEAGTREPQQGNEVDDNPEHATGEIPWDDDEDLDKQLEEAYSGGIIVDTKDDDNCPPEDWETEITTPFYIGNNEEEELPKKAYLFGKKVFCPSDLHPATTRRQCPEFKVVEGQFDDADT